MTRREKKPLSMWDAEDVDTLARTVLGEARGEKRAGQIAVAHVVKNRWVLGRWGKTIKAVCLRPKQFSAWNPDDPNFPLLSTITFNDPTYQHCYFIALGVLLGEFPDYSCGADHYLNPKAVKRLPKWYDENKVVARIGRHHFLKLH